VLAVSWTLVVVLRAVCELSLFEALGNTGSDVLLVIGGAEMLGNETNVELIIGNFSPGGFA